MSAAESVPPFQVAGHKVAAGRALDVEIPVARIPGGSWASLPLRVIHGASPGPTIWLSGAIHGDELVGVMIVRRLIERLQARKLSGTVLAVPIVNVFGIATGSRNLPDRRDLNRSFPGSAKGSLAARLAHLFFANVASRCELGLDFHTASNGRDNLPQIRGNLDDADVRRYATAFAAPLVLHAGLRDGSLRAAAMAKGIHVLLYEAGEANRLEPGHIQTGVEGTLRVMTDMGMLAGPAPESTARPRFSRKSAWVRAPHSGFCTVTVEPGGMVRPGQTIASIDDGIGKRITPVLARGEGMVIGVLRSAVVHRGDALVHVAEVAEVAEVDQIAETGE